MKILRASKNNKLRNLKAGDVFSFISCMDESNPDVYRLIDYKTVYCLTKNVVKSLYDDDFNCLVHRYDNPILDLRNQQ